MLARKLHALQHARNPEKAGPPERRHRTAPPREQRAAPGILRQRDRQGSAQQEPPAADCVAHRDPVPDGVELGLPPRARRLGHGDVPDEDEADGGEDLEEVDEEDLGADGGGAVLVYGVPDRGGDEEDDGGDEEDVRGNHGGVGPIRVPRPPVVSRALRLPHRLLGDRRRFEGVVVGPFPRALRPQLRALRDGRAEQLVTDENIDLARGLPGVFAVVVRIPHPLKDLAVVAAKDERVPFAENQRLGLVEVESVVEVFQRGLSLPVAPRRGCEGARGELRVGVVELARVRERDFRVGLVDDLDDAEVARDDEEEGADDAGGEGDLGGVAADVGPDGPRAVDDPEGVGEEADEADVPGHDVGLPGEEAEPEQRFGLGLLRAGLNSLGVPHLAVVARVPFVDVAGGVVANRCVRRVPKGPPVAGERLVAEDGVVARAVERPAFGDRLLVGHESGGGCRGG
mmetsp:Transcript_9454/g.24784  ORF Transcript_9454/g.24784 Transcript_9454/m.24784 type:complete len:457 (-) Transcript_9454:68-1438(-)